MLRIEQVSKAFGGLLAVNDVSLELSEAGITGLVGPNGSGKTTLFHLITGFYKLDRGRIFLQEQLISELPPYRINRMGLVRTFQQTRILPFLSTVENLLAAVPKQTGESLCSVFLRPGLVRQEERENRERAIEILEILKLEPLSQHLAGTLSYGQQKLLELGRVLMAQPRLILLDEPTAGINPTLIRQLVDVMADLVAKGIRIFLIEHNMPLVAEICRTIYVMDSGSLIFRGAPSDAAGDPRVIEAYLGRQGHAA
jgi:ABC-type branched-subunit amino acid transport system ATPase component